MAAVSATGRTSATPVSRTGQTAPNTAGLGSAWYFNSPSTQQPRTAAATARETSRPRPPAPPPVLAGQAAAVTGDSLRITGVTVILDGIETPEPGQSCMRSGRRWRCGAAARNALAREIRGRRVVCDVTGTVPRSNGPPAARARCSVNGVDVAANLVRAGSVFASEGFFARYGSLESQARSAKAGLWSGEARPSDRPPTAPSVGRRPSAPLPKAARSRAASPPAPASTCSLGRRPTTTSGCEARAASAGSAARKRRRRRVGDPALNLDGRRQVKSPRPGVGRGLKNCDAPRGIGGTAPRSRSLLHLNLEVLARPRPGHFGSS